MILTPLPASTWSNTLVNLLSRSRIKNLNRTARSPKSMNRLRACWAVHARDVHAAGADLHREQDVQALEEHGVTVRKSHDKIPAAWEARNCRQVGDVRRGAGVNPAEARIRRIVLAPMR